MILNVRIAALLKHAVLNSLNVPEPTFRRGFSAIPKGAGHG